MNKPSPDANGESLEDFAAAVAGNGAAADALADFAARRRMNANLLIYLLWRAQSGRGDVDTAGVERLLAAVQPWQEAVGDALRALPSVAQRLWERVEGAHTRRFLDAAASIGRDADRVARLLLASAQDPPAPTPIDDDGAAAAAALSITGYFQTVGVGVVPRDRIKLGALLAALWPSLTPERVAALASLSAVREASSAIMNLEPDWLRDADPPPR